MFVPPVIVTVWSGAEFTIVKFGYVPPVVIPVPPLIVTVWSGEVFVIVTEPLLVDADIPVPFVTELTGRLKYVVADIVFAVKPPVKFVAPDTVPPVNVAGGKL